MQRLGLIVTIAVAIVLMVLIVWRSWEPAGRSLAPSADGAAVPAPEAGSVTLGGDRWRLQDQRGKVVLLDFWATWCEPCLASLPRVKEIREKFKNNSDFVLVGVSQDRTKGELESFVRENNLDWLQIFDKAGDHEMARKFGVDGIPATFLIDRKGNIRRAVKGIDPAPEELVKEIEKLLKTGE
jgi:peroxiredoxin